MNIKSWEGLPSFMRCEEVRPYFEVLKKREKSLKIKRAFDVIVSGVLLILLFPLLLILGILIKMDSPGPVFFRQVRVTQYGRKFRIFKFRTMVHHAERMGSQVTVKNDARVTRVGAKIRKVRLDEIPQLMNIFLGDMSFVGTRPEVPKYVERYPKEMNATLLLPAGVTSRASIFYKDEEKLLECAEDADQVYMKEVLPGKMKWNLEDIRNFSLMHEIGTLFQTLFAVVK